MSCNLQYNKQGKLTGVLNDDGTPSLLYKEAVNKFGQEEGLNIFLTSKSDEFTNDFGYTEPSLKQVLNFITAQQKTDTGLTTSERISARNFMVDNLQDKLKAAFYDENGIFSVNWEKLVKSGLYSTYEAQNLQKDVELQERVKDAVEALENTPLDESQFSFDAPLEKSNEFNDFGKLQIINPYIVEATILQTLGGIKTQEEFNDKLSTLEYPNFQQKVDKEVLFQEMSQLQRAENYQESDGIISNQTVSNTTIILPQVVQPSENFEMIKNLQFLLAMRQDVLEESPEQVKVMLKSVEDGAIAEGIDLVGLSEKAVDMPFLNSLNTFILFPSEENTNKFAEEYDRFFEKDNAQLTTPIEATSGRNYVLLDTKLSEQEVFIQFSLIKVKDEQYIRVKPKPLEEMYDVLLTYPEKFAAEIKTKEQLKKFVQNEISQMEGFTNADIAESVYLFKKYFDVPVISENEIHDISTAPFTGNQEYLTTDFVSDFYIDGLKEKANNSGLWKNFYSHFGVNAKGIFLIDNNPMTIMDVEDYLNSGEIKRTENLRQYSILSQQLPNFTQQTDPEITEQTLRNEAINNPQTIGKFTGQLYKVNEEALILKSSNEKFIRLNDGSIHENLESNDNLSLYAKLPVNNSSYNVLNKPAPQTDIKINNYAYLENSPEKFTKQENRLNKTEENNLNKTIC